MLQEDGRACRCFLFSGYERVTRSDADVLCSFHDAAWVAEIDYPGKCVDVVSKSASQALLPAVYIIIHIAKAQCYVLCSIFLFHFFLLGLNYWLKARLLETTDVGEYASFWLGATTNVSGNC